MCELLGLCANEPADIRFSFSGLKERGGRTGVHKDGWGVSLYEGRASNIFRDTQSSVKSEMAHFFQNTSLKSKIIISHIRQANRGRVCLENTHPFKRELWGCDWVFAHNGQLKGIKKNKHLQFYRPVGSTDSEYAFCYLMDKIRDAFPSRPRSNKQLWQLIEAVAHEINEHGIFSFLLSDSRYMYAFCSNRMCWVTRQYPFSKARLVDTGKVIDFSKRLKQNEIVTVIASKALTDNEDWHCMEKGEFRVFSDGVSKRLAA